MAAETVTALVGRGDRNQLAFFVLLTGAGMLWERTRSFFYGAMCSLLALPGLVVAALVTA